MKAHPFIAILASLIIFSCGDSNGGKDVVKVFVSETETAKTLNASGQQQSIITEDGQQLIIIQDVDTALYVRDKEGNQTPLCDAVYHDPKMPWGAGKTIVAVKGNSAYVFTIIQDGDAAALRLTKTVLPIDAVASLVGNTDGSFNVSGLRTEDGTTHDFSSND